jgi:hypothetical protein
MNYQIIADENELKKFIEWLPDLNNDETYFVSLFSRSKYCSEENKIKGDKTQLKRFTTNKENLFDKLKQLECEFGAYTIKGQPIPQESLAAYISINPRSFKKAAINGLKRLADLIRKVYDGYNPHQEILTEIQKAKSRTCFIDFDFDCEKKLYTDVINTELINVVNKEAIHILFTRGGFHILIAPEMINETYKKNWYQNVSNIQNKYSTDKDNNGDNLLPIPGTFQGGYIPKLYVF